MSSFTTAYNDLQSCSPSAAAEISDLAAQWSNGIIGRTSMVQWSNGLSGLQVWWPRQRQNYNVQHAISQSKNCPTPLCVCCTCITYYGSGREPARCVVRVYRIFPDRHATSMRYLLVFKGGLGITGLLLRVWKGVQTRYGRGKNQTGKNKKTKPKKTKQQILRESWIRGSMG